MSEAGPTPSANQLPKRLSRANNQRKRPNSNGRTTIRAIFQSRIRFSHLVFLLLSMRYVFHEANRKSWPRQGWWPGARYRTSEAPRYSGNFHRAFFNGADRTREEDESLTAV
jgi:hypothetical protein